MYKDLLLIRTHLYRQMINKFVGIKFTSKVNIPPPHPRVWLWLEVPLHIKKIPKNLVPIFSSFFSPSHTYISYLCLGNLRRGLHRWRWSHSGCGLVHCKRSYLSLHFSFRFEMRGFLGLPKGGDHVTINVDH